MTFVRSCLLAVTGWIVGFSLGAGTSAAQAPRGRDRAGKDYAAELPRLPLKSPAESRAMFSSRPGFSVELVAAEPLLRSPVAMDFDEDGRLYVAEFPEYNEYASPRPLGRGCIRLLEDADDDGVFEKSSLFADGLPMACAVACWDGGILVGSPPDLLYLKDRDGDGKADVRRIVLTGFGQDRAGEAMINSIRWGLDNRFHISTGGDGGELRRDPGNVKGTGARPMSVRNQNLLLDPLGETVELTGGGGQHGMTMDDWGRTYVCNNSDPFRFLAYDTRYLARNPHLLAPPALVSVAPEGKFTKLFRHSPVEPWRALRTRLRREGVVPGSDEGGTPSGFFTGATGVTVYRGDAFPAEFRGNLFVGDVSNNIIHRAVAEPDGVLVRARGAEAGREFLASRDCFFRPVQMANGPDGCLWVIDMYRELIEGAAFLPPEILQHMDVGSGVDRGRIWRIVPAGLRRRPTPRLDKAPTLELVELLEHPNGWHRDTAARLLHQRQDLSALPGLERLASGSSSPLGRIHALFALSGLGRLGPEPILTALGDREPKVREQALRLAESFSRSDAKIRGRLLAMSDDPDPRVRYQLAFSLGAIPGAEAVPALVTLASRDGADPWMRLAILTAASDRAGEIFTRLVSDPASRGSRHVRLLLLELSGQAAASGRAEDLAAISRCLAGPLAADRSFAGEVVSALVGRASPATTARLASPEMAAVRAILDATLREALVVAADESRPAAKRADAIRLLRMADFDKAEPPLIQALASRQPPEVQLAAVEALSRFDDTRVATDLLRSWPTMTPKLRVGAAEVLFSRPAWVGAFLDAVEEGTVSRSDVEPSRLDLLRLYPDEAVRKRAARVLTLGMARRVEVIAEYRKALDLKGDRTRGKAVFEAHCGTCHRLEGVGQQIGAELRAVRDRGLDAILLNILDPNREVLPPFLSYVISTDSGRVVTGMISAETANSLTVRRPDGGEETIPRAEIEELRSTGLSFMPEGLEKLIDVPKMADLLAFLNSAK